MRKILSTKAALMAAFLLSGCYWKVPIAANERGLELPDGVKISSVLPPGRYGPNLGFYSSIVRIDCSVKTISWTPPEDELVTRDKQPIGITLAVSYERDCGSEAIAEMYSTYQAEAISDEALASLVETRIPRVAKEATAKFTLDQMLGIAEGDQSGRNIVTHEVERLLTKELSEFNALLVDIGINNIDPSDSYLRLLQEKADAQVAVEVAAEKTRLAEQELLREEKQTLVELELARRENLINEELAQVFEGSPQYYELERLKLLANVIGENDKVYFVPTGGDITLFLGGQNQYPVPVKGN